MPQKTLLVIGYAPSSNTQRLITACRQGYRNSGYTQQVLYRSLNAPDVQPNDILQAHALLIVTPENLSYMSGMMKDVFDRCYYPLLDHTQGLPCTAIIRAGQGGGDATAQALKTITTGLRWRWVQAPVQLRGPWQEDFLAQAQDLTQAVTIALAEGMI